MGACTRKSRDASRTRLVEANCLILPHMTRGQMRYSSQNLPHPWFPDCAHRISSGANVQAKNCSGRSAAAALQLENGTGTSPPAAAICGLKAEPRGGPEPGMCRAVLRNRRHFSKLTLGVVLQRHLPASCASQLSELPGAGESCKHEEVHCGAAVVENAIESCL
jgi:hypothetical protein